MIKNIFFFLTISFCAFLIVPTTYACDPLGCLLGGHKQDTLILGEVTSIVDDEKDIKIIFLFPQNQISSLHEGDIITVKSFNKSASLSDEEDQTASEGKKYLMSLNQNDNFYVPAWGIYEVAGANYSDAQLVENNTADKAALQIFINSAGTERNFYFDGDKAYLKTDNDNEDIQIYPKEKNILWYAAEIGILILIAGSALILRKKK